MPDPGALVDCERLREGFLAQPINSLTALAFLVAALYAVARDGRRAGWWAVLLASVAAGAFAFHGPIPPWAGWLHDSSIAAVLLFVALVNLTLQRLIMPAILVGAALVAAFPAVADALLASLGGAAVATSVFVGRTRPLLVVGLATAAIGAPVGRLSATGGPWCFPDSPWQGHGFWHLAAAIALALWWDSGVREPKEERATARRYGARS